MVVNKSFVATKNTSFLRYLNPLARQSIEYELYTYLRCCNSDLILVYLNHFYICIYFISYTLSPSHFSSFFAAHYPFSLGLFYPILFAFCFYTLISLYPQHPCHSSLPHDHFIHLQYHLFILARLYKPPSSVHTLFIPTSPLYKCTFKLR